MIKIKDVCGFYGKKLLLLEKKSRKLAIKLTKN